MLGLQPLDAEIAHVIEDPDAERLTGHAAAGRVVDHRALLLPRDDPGVGELAVAGVGVEPAHREHAAEHAGIAEPEHDVAVAEDLPAPLVPSGHVGRDLHRRQLAFAAGPVAAGPQ